MLSLKLLKSCIISFDSQKNPTRDGVSPRFDNEASWRVSGGAECLTWSAQTDFLALETG